MAHDQLVELKKQLIEMANTKFGDQYIFGGGNNLVPPFSEKAGNLNSGAATVAITDVTGLSTGMQVSGTGIPAGTVISAVTSGPPSSLTLSNAATTTTTGSKLNFYSGDGTQREVEIAANSRQAISTTGDRLLLGIGSDPSYGTTNVLQTFDNLIAAVGDATTPSDPAAVIAASRALEPAAKQVFSAVTTNIARIHRVDNMAKLNNLNKTTLSDIASSIQNVDLVKYGVQLEYEKTAFEASLSATAKVAQMSLLNYL
jgi:flagellar hook-associated protein 3 FlgL